MKKLLAACVMAFLSVSGFSCDNDDVQAKDYDLSFDNVAVREGVTATIHCKVFVNNPHKNGRAIVAIHGAGHTAATWESFAKAVFAHHRHGAVSRFVAIEMPGHGLSSLPSGMLFGDMNVDDYVNVAIETLEKLKENKIRPSILIGHSMGTMVAQQLQQTLINRGTSLKRAFDIDKVILLAPTLPDGLPYSIMDSGAGSGILAQFVSFTPELGTILYFPEYVWPYVFFANRMGQPAQGTPPVEEMIAKGYGSPESLMFALQVVGALPFYNRPVIDKGIFGFKKGTLLKVVCFENDILLLPDEGKTLFTHLVGKHEMFSRYILIEGPDAVHDYYISNPELLVDEIFGVPGQRGKISPRFFSRGK